MKNILLNKIDTYLGFVLSVTGLLLFAQMLVTMLGGSFALAGPYWKTAHILNTQYSFFVTWCIASGFSALPFMMWMWGFARFNRYVENKKVESWTVVQRSEIEEIQEIQSSANN